MSMLEEEQVVYETIHNSLMEDFQFFSSGGKGTIAYRACGELTLPSAHVPSVNERLNSPVKCSGLNWSISLDWQAVSLISSKKKQIVLSMC